MNFELFALPAVALVTVTALVLLLSPDWRWSIAALGVQYAGEFVLVALSWPLAMAGTKLVAGWMAGAILGMAVLSLPSTRTPVDPLQDIPDLLPLLRDSRHGRVRGFPNPQTTASRPFRLLTAILAGLTVFSVVPIFVERMPGIYLEQAWGGLILISTALLQLGFTSKPLRTTLSLLTLLAGFEIIYSGVESSALVAGLLAGVNLILALAGAYLLMAPQMEAE